ncbi:MAG TPA: class I SAM-dependent methyltransferase [Balneolales bacterium]|nr:class I SAM-dependent methyltransferase [Balneolales bacterium]
MELVNPDIEKYAKTLSLDESELLLNISKTTHEELEYDQMLSGKLEGRFLRMLIQLTGAKRILEIGMFTGYSALTMAEALPDDGNIITCDTNERYANIARRFFEKSPCGYKISIKMGPALETLKKIKGPFDLIFLDADKNNYPEYYRILHPMLEIGGLLIVDNAFWDGKVIDRPDEKSMAIDRLNRMIYDDPTVENVLLTIRDGINLVRRVR